MSAVAPPVTGLPDSVPTASAAADGSPRFWSLALRSGRVVVGGGVLLFILLACLATLPWTLRGNPPPYEHQSSPNVRQPPTGASPAGWFGYDALGRSLLARCLLGGTISLAVGAAAATISGAPLLPVGVACGKARLRRVTI